MDPLLDTSWTLHHTSTPSPTYQSLFTRHTTPTQVSQYFSHLPNFLNTQTPQYRDEFNDTSEKLGSLRDVKTTIHHPRPSTTFIHLQLIYQHTTLTFTLYTPHLLLSKSPQTHITHITNYLADTFNNVAFTPLKLPSSLLSNSLQTYISTLVASTGRYELGSEHRAAILRTAMGTLKVTISFSGPVAPHLRTVDLSVPYETVDVLVSEDGRGKFTGKLSEYVHLQTGLKLPLSVDADDAGGGTSVFPVRISKLAAAAFAISVEGKLRFAAKAVTNSGEYENTIVAANLGMLDGIVQEAIKQINED